MKKILIAFVLIQFLLPSAVSAIECSSDGYKGSCKVKCGKGEDPAMSQVCPSGQLCCIAFPADYFSATKEDSEPTAEAEAAALEKAEKEKKEIIKSVSTDLNPMDIGKPTDLFSRAINAMLAFIGSIVLILYIYSGFLWMSSSGNADQIKKAKNILIWTTLGAVAMAASFMIVKTVLDKIG